MKNFYIKERHNPQLGVYYVAMGQITKKEARSYEKSLYGDNVMLSFDTEDAYKAKIGELRTAGERVQ